MTKRKLFDIVAVNDDTSDDPIMCMFDSAATRTKFLAHIEPRFKDDGWKMVDQMTERDINTLVTTINVMTMEDLDEALAEDDPTEYLQDGGFQFYGELQDIYDI